MPPIVKSVIASVVGKVYNPITGSDTPLGTGILRFATATNRYTNFPLAVNPAYVLGSSARHKHVVGSGALTEIRLVAYNNYIWLGSVDTPGNSLTIVDTFVEIGTKSVRVTWSGANGTTLENNAVDVVSDALTPAAFGLTEFPQGMVFFVRCQVTIPNTGSARLPVTTAWDTDVGSGGYYNVANTTCNNIGETGELRYTGTQTYTGGWTPLVVGKFKSGDPRVWIGAGDSIFDGVGDNQTTGMGRGFFSRALMGTAYSEAIAGLNISRSSGNAQAWGGSLLPNFLAKYANGIVEEYGTNSFDNTANIDLSGVLYNVGLSRHIWEACKAAASTAKGAAQFKVLRTKLLARTNTPTGNTPADQTIYGDKWNVNGNVDTFNSRLAIEALVDDFISFDDIIRASQDMTTTDFHKWLTGLLMTADGTHPTTMIHILNAARLRSRMLAA